MRIVRLMLVILLYLVLQTGLIVLQQPAMVGVIRPGPVMEVQAAGIEPPAVEPAYQNPMVMMLDAEIQTYTYRLDEEGHAIWRAAGVIPPGVMIKKIGGCPDGFTQVEYPDPEGGWIVAFMKCDP